MKKHNLKWIWI